MLESPQLVKWLNEIEAKRDALLRLAIFGNAGGTIAALSFIGTMVGQRGQFDRATFVVLCFFLAGLVGGGLGRFAQWRIAKITYERSTPYVLRDHQGYYPGVSRGWERTLNWALAFCCSMLGTGIVLGFLRLFELSAP